MEVDNQLEELANAEPVVSTVVEETGAEHPPTMEDVVEQVEAMGQPAVEELTTPVSDPAESNSFLSPIKKRATKKSIGALKLGYYSSRPVSSRRKTEINGIYHFMVRCFLFYWNCRRIQRSHGRRACCNWCHSG